MGSATIRCPIPSRSIVTLTGSSFFSPSLLLSPSLPFSPALPLSASLPLSPLAESFFLIRNFFLIALRLHRRRITLLEHRRVNTSQNGVLETGQIQPGRGKSHVGADRKEQRFPAFIKHRIARVADSVCDLRFLARLDGIHENGPLVILEQFGVRQPLAIRRPRLSESGSWIIVAVGRDFHR